MQKEDQVLTKLKEHLSQYSNKIENMRQQLIFLEGSKKAIEQLIEELSKENE